jgi:hypothetical protein
MGHIITLGVQLRGAIHDILQNAEKFRYDLFPAGHGCFDCGPRELSDSSIELAQNLGYFHTRHPVRRILVGANCTLAPPNLDCPTKAYPCQNRV